MKPKKRAKDIVDSFIIEINQSDFHIPRYMREKNVPYNITLESETKLLAKECAKICVDEIIKSIPFVTFTVDQKPYWKKVKRKIELL